MNVQSILYLSNIYVTRLFSIAQLRELRDLYRNIIDEKLLLGCLYAHNVVGAGIDRAENRFVVRIEEYSQNNINGLLKNIVYSPMIIFEQAERYSHLLDTSYDHLNELYSHIEPLNARINPGDRLSIRFIFLEGRGSMGYRVRRVSDGAIGFISSGHIFDFAGQRVYPHLTLATHIGTVERMVDNSEIDASFVITHTEAGNTLPTGATLSQLVRASFVQGELMLMFGATTGGESRGTVQDPDHDFIFDGINRRGMVRTNITARAGDSGGTVATGMFMTAGVVGWGPISSPGMIFVPAHRINRIFGVERY
ncbi:MAG: S1 family peptidase [Defluviitaleaceae bacterium]|nr:S1 family peptidase [Defluviitaleaceae bacterium]MCL2274826.1 S1 family peptidase [Defluviitaleaceae bacterium]